MPQQKLIEMLPEELQEDFRPLIDEQLHSEEENVYCQTS